MKLPAVIRSAREAKGLTQAQVGERLGCSASTVAGWELGTHKPRAQKLADLAQAIGTSKSQLVRAYFEAA